MLANSDTKVEILIGGKNAGGGGGVGGRALKVFAVAVVGAVKFEFKEDDVVAEI
jgi:hypothetical protein